AARVARSVNLHGASLWHPGTSTTKRLPGEAAANANPAPIRPRNVCRMERRKSRATGCGHVHLLVSYS
ncbi:MAG: hypothetical protein U1E05_03465, partial [Patescibacteria group bacterium]|nr:hypothetical protein [Patescibacteria group bacterium]